MTYELQENMSKNLITINQNDSLELAYEKMANNEIRHLPVLNDQNCIVGILSDRDLQRALKSKVSETGLIKFESCEFDPENKVCDYMSWPVQSLEKDINIKIAAQKMVNEKISAFIVADKDSAIGIITTDDLLKVLVSLLSNPKSNFHLSLGDLITNPKIGAFAQTLADIGI